MTFWKCFYHLTWATQYRQPLINTGIYTVIESAVQDRSHDMKCHILVLNMMPDHIHIAANIPPSVAIADYAQNLKGVSAYRVNQVFPQSETTFRWQKGYGVLTFGEDELPYVQAYIKNQQLHHQNNTIDDDMETLS